MSTPDRTETTAEEYREVMVRWLRHKETKWQETARRATGAAADAASFYAAAYGNAADGVALGQPERWARAEDASNG